MRRADGAQVTATVAPYSDMLHEYGSQHRWDEAVGVCRFVEDRGCWCALASMALEASNLDVAEISLAALREVDKLQYILYVKSIPSAEARNAELALYKRRPDDAERILLQATPPLVYRAIKMRIRAFQWDKALDLAVKHRSHVDTVLAYRSASTSRRTRRRRPTTASSSSTKQVRRVELGAGGSPYSRKDTEKREEAARSGGPPPDPAMLPSIRTGRQASEVQDDRGTVSAVGLESGGAVLRRGWTMQSSSSIQKRREHSRRPFAPCHMAHATLRARNTGASSL